MSKDRQATQVTMVTRRESSVLHKVRWSLRQRLRKRLLQLSVECLDEIDDMLFSGGIGDESVTSGQSLDVMREVRTKRSDFLGRFTETVVERLRSKDSAASERKVATRPKPGVTIELNAKERMEIEFALDAMRRRGERRYQQTLVEIATLQQERRNALQGNVIAATELLRDIVQGFAEAQQLFRVPLQTRLVICKLFEQQVLLQLDQALQDIVRVIKRADDEEFVARLFTSSSAIRQRSLEQTRQVSAWQGKNEQGLAADSVDGDSRRIQEIVERLLSEHIDESTVPGFIGEMIRSHWRSVLFMLGLQYGVDSAEWSEAKYALLLLLSACEDSEVLSESEKGRLLARFNQGFRQIRLNAATRDSLLAELEACLGCVGRPEDATGELAARRSDRDSLAVRESSISPAGEGLLAPDDLSELADLFGDKGKEQDKSQAVDLAKSATYEPSDFVVPTSSGSPSFSVTQATLASNYLDRELSVCLAAIDALPPRIQASIEQAGRPRPCIVIRSRASEGREDGTDFDLYLKETRRSLRQSRLALALALQAGDLRLYPGVDTPITASETVSKPSAHAKTVMRSDMRRH